MTEYADIVASVIESLEAERASHWAIGDALALLPVTRGVAKAVASEVGQSGTWVSDHQKASRTFAPDKRDVNWSFQHHVICSRTSDPFGWMDKVAANEWSTRELKEALKEAGEIKTREETPKVCPHCGGEL